MAALKQAALASDETKHSADLETVLLDGETVYSAADDGKIKVWNKDLVLQKEIQAHDYAVYHLLIHDGKLFSASIDSNIKVWQLPGLEAVATLTNHEEAVRRLATNGERLFSGDEKGDVIAFDLKSLASVNKYEVMEEVWDLAARGNLFFTVRDRGLSVTEFKADNTSMYTVVKALQGRAPMVLSANHLFFCESGTGVKILVHRAQPNEFPKVTEIDASSKIVTCLSAATVSGSERIISGSYDNEVKVFEIPSGKVLYSTPLPSTPSAVAMATDGTVYVGGPDGYLAKFTA